MDLQRGKQSGFGMAGSYVSASSQTTGRDGFGPATKIETISASTREKAAPEIRFPWQAVVFDIEINQGFSEKFLRVHPRSS